MQDSVLIDHKTNKKLFIYEARCYINIVRANSLINLIFLFYFNNQQEECDWHSPYKF